MPKISDTNDPLTLDNTSGKVLPTPTKIDLKSIDDVRVEMAKVYRKMKSREIETSDGTKLVYVLAQIGKMIEVHDIEKRIEMLEAKQMLKNNHVKPNVKLMADEELMTIVNKENQHADN